MKAKDLKAKYQPIVDIQCGEIIGFEATILGVLENDKTIGYEALREANGYDDLDFKARDKALNEFKIEEYKLFVNSSPKEMSKPLFYEDIDLSNVVWKSQKNLLLRTEKE
ncbi:EAL domain-containing protein [Peribacillus sp. S4]|uniref:EAL domain-containing protein n=1 Tax=Peribacillus sp. S4 TaxID=3384451 RepID=UPI0039895B9E